MGSYEERVVDRGVDQAWMQLRLRLADLLASATAEEPIGIAFTPLAAGDGDEAPALIVDADGTDISVRIVTDDPWIRVPSLIAAERWRLVELGMKIENGGPVLLVDANEVDRAAHYVYAVLHEMWEVVHPSFLAIDPEDSGSSTSRSPKRSRHRSRCRISSIRRRSSRSTSGSTPRSRRSSATRLSGTTTATSASPARERSRAIVSVRSEHRIEVWTILAKDVDRKKAHRQIDRLSRQYSFHRFFVVNDMLVASIVLFADPFVPASSPRAPGHVVRQRAPREPGKKLENPAGEPARTRFPSSTRG